MTFRREDLAEGVTLYCGDCREVFIKPVDAVITDPPYGIGFPYASYLDSEENLRDLVESFVPHFRAIAKRVVITPGISNLHNYPKPEWIGAWTWETTATYGALGYNQWQPILFYGEELKGFGNINGVIKSDRIHFRGGSAKMANECEVDHSCPKPTEFLKRLILRFSLPDETVCDPFMGSGTTGVAAVKEGRQFVGIEIEPRYFDIACRRISDALACPDLFIAAPKPIEKQEALL